MSNRPLAVLLAAFMLIGIGLLGSAGFLAREYSVWMARTRTASGTVIDVQSVHNTERATVRFTAAGGREWEIASQPPERGSLRAGQSATVRYEPGRPASGEIDGLRSLTLAVILGVTGAGFVLVVSAATRILMRDRRNARDWAVAS